MIPTKASAAKEAPTATPAILLFERAGAGSATGAGGGDVAEAELEEVGELLVIVLEGVVVDGEFKNDDDVDEREVVDLVVGTVVEVVLLVRRGAVELRVRDGEE